MLKCYEVKQIEALTMPIPSLCGSQHPRQKVLLKPTGRYAQYASWSSSKIREGTLKLPPAAQAVFEEEVAKLLQAQAA